MGKWLFLVLLAACAVKAWHDFGPGSRVAPLHGEPYVAVYGRQSCGYTMETLTALQGADLDVRFYSVDHAPTAEVLHRRMEKAGLSTRRYKLPVVDVNGTISERPAVPDVISDYEDRDQ